MLNWTELPDKSGTTMTAHSGTWPDLLERIRNAGTFPSKEKCPWVKLATFGAIRSPKGSLRHNDNTQAVYGIEGDYDGEVMTMEKAAHLLESYGIRAALYPSPSNTAEKPRWRVIAPLARQHTPAERAGLVARLNGALNGILAGESFTLSQGYFFGATPTNDYRVITTFDDPEDGRCIDDLDELDEIAIGKTAEPAPPSMDGNALANAPAYADPAVVRDLRSALTALRADNRKLWVDVGHALKTIGDQGRSLWLEWSQTSDKYDPQDASTRWDTFNPTNTGYQSVFAKAQAAGWVNPASKSAQSSVTPINTSMGGLTIDNETGEVLPPMLKSVSVCDVLTNPSPPPAFIWDGYLPRGVVTLLGAHGGTGKSTIALMLSVCAALGRPLFGVDTVPCKVLFVSLEDGENIVRHRLAYICNVWGINPHDLHGRLHIVDGTEHPELFSAETRGAGETTRTYFEMRQLVQLEGVGLVVVDNASDAYGGDEIQRRQVRAFMRALGVVARLTNCAVLLLAHVDKNTSRARTAEGGEGYSGSTAWHNSARSRLFMTREKDGLLKLEHQKSNLGKMREPIKLEWPEANLPRLLESQSGGVDLSGFAALQLGRADDERSIAVLKLIAEFESRGQYCHTPANSRSNVHAILKSDPAFLKLNMRKDDTSRIVTQCQRAKWIEGMEYRTKDRKTHDRWTLTAEGRLFAGLPPVPSAPSAPSVPNEEHGADGAAAQRRAPSAPSGAGGVGVERAHISINSDGAPGTEPPTAGIEADAKGSAK